MAFINAGDVHKKVAVELGDCCRSTLLLTRPLSQVRGTYACEALGTPNPTC